MDVVLVDATGSPCGAAEKLAAHRAPGRPHLAFSVVIVRDRGELLLQRRSMSKYHFGGLWSNSCCGHPLPGETVEAATRRRVRHELGVGLSRLRVLDGFWYRASDPESGLVEHEWDTVVLAALSGSLRPDESEVSDVRWVSLTDAQRLCRDEPAQVTPWLAPVLSIVAQSPELEPPLPLGRPLPPADRSQGG